MSEQRKIQLATEVDASGASAGFEQIKRGSRAMAQAVAQDGAAAGKGLDAVADGAKRAADGFTRDEGRIRSAIQRATVDIQTLGKSMSEKLEAKISLQGLDAAKFAPYLASLKEVEAAQTATAAAASETAAAIKAAQVQSGRQSSFLDGLKQQSDAIGKTRSQLLELQAAQLGVANAAAPYIAKLREAEQASKTLGAATGQLTAFQRQQIGFQLHDFGVQVLSGQSPITALVQQGSQLSGTFGGAGNAIKAVTSLITPMTVAFAGAAVTVGGLALAMAHAESSMRDLARVQTQLTGTGRGNLFSTKELKDYLAELALAPGVTRETATAIVSELSKVQGISPVFKDLGRLANDYAAVTGQKVPEATRQLARAFSDPEKGAKQLDEALGALSSSQLLQIERLTRLGDVAGAQRVLFDALRDSVRGLADQSLTPLQRSTNELGNAWERLQRSFGESEGLRTLLGLLASAIDKVTWLVNNAPKLGGLPSIAASAVPFAGAPVTIANTVTSGVKRLLGFEDTAAGKDTATASAKAADTAAIANGGKVRDDEIKRALEAGKAYKSQASEIANLKQVREQMNKALKESNDLYGKDSEQSKQLRGSISGINEKIASIGKRGQGGSGGNEAQQVLDAELQQRVKAAQDAMAAERDAVAFSQRYLQGVYQAGALSLKDFYDQKRQAIEQGTAAEIGALEKERAAVQQHLEATKKTSPKDTSALVKDQTRLQEIDSQEAKLRTGASREVVLANQEEATAFRQLSEQVLSYRANLLQLQGDEVGAAKVRAQIAIEQSRVLARQSQGSASPITAADQAATERALTQTNEIAAARTRLGVVTQSLATEEDRIATLQRVGAIGELEALDRIGAARSARLGQLQKEVEALEKLSKERPADLQLNLDTSRARAELERLKLEIDPLKQKFDGIFKDAGANLFSDLATGTKPLQAIRKFADNISREISGVVSRQLSDQIFGDGGAFGGLGKVAADVFGSKNRGVSLDTSAASQSLTNLRTAADPASNSLTQLTESAQATAVALRQITGTPLPPGPGGRAGDFARYDRTLGSEVPTADGSGSTGDFTRFDRAQEKATESTNAGAKADQNAARAVTQLAAAAANGGSALNSLQGIIAAISSAGGYGNPGGLIGAGLGALFGGGAASDVAFGSTTFADAFAGGLIPMSSGGYTGDVDPKQVAGVVHGKEYVFSAEATKAIGVDHLERLHRMAKTGRWGQGDRPTGYAEGGYVSTVWQPSSMNYLVPPPSAATPGASYITNHHNNITVQAPPGMSRATAMQLGAEMGRGIEIARARNGKRSGR